MNIVLVLLCVLDSPLFGDSCKKCVFKLEQMFRTGLNVSCEYYGVNLTGIVGHLHGLARAVCPTHHNPAHFVANIYTPLRIYLNSGAKV